MAKTKDKTPQRMGVSAVEQAVLATAHSLVTALHRVGALDAVNIRDIDGLCLPARPDCDGPETKRIRAATRMRQPVFARLPGVDKPAVAQWGRGARRRSGPASRLLEPLDPEQPESPIVQIRRGMERPA